MAAEGQAWKARAHSGGAGGLGTLLISPLLLHGPPSWPQGLFVGCRGKVASLRLSDGAGCRVCMNLGFTFFHKFKTFLKHKIYFNYIRAKLSLGYKCWGDL